MADRRRNAAAPAPSSPASYPDGRSQTKRSCARALFSGQLPRRPNGKSQTKRGRKRNTAASEPSSPANYPDGRQQMDDCFRSRPIFSSLLLDGRLLPAGRPCRSPCLPSPACCLHETRTPSSRTLLCSPADHADPPSSSHTLPAPPTAHPCECATAPAAAMLPASPLPMTHPCCQRPSLIPPLSRMTVW